MRDRLASGGAQRLCRAGTANGHVAGAPHDPMYPLSRFVQWMGDDDILTANTNAVIAGEFEQHSRWSTRSR